MQVFFGIAYLVVGFAQLFAVSDGIGRALHFNGVFSLPIAAMITYIPLVGSGLGIFGAVSVWNWSIWQAAALFLWYVPVYLVLLTVDAIGRRR